MPLYSIQGPDGKTYSIDGPEGATREQVIAAIQARMAEQEAAPKPQTGFFAGLKGGFESLKGDVAALGVPLGIEGSAATAEEYKKKSEQIYRQPELTEAPWEYVKGLAGQSLAYMGAPLAAGAAAAFLAPEAAVAGIGAAALARFGTSAAQFVGSNINRQIESGTKPEDVDAVSAVGAAIPQALLDAVALGQITGMQRIFKEAGKTLSREEAAAIVRNGVVGTTANAVKAYGPAVLKSMGTEGLTEAAQQVLERAQAGLDITDEQARKEYFDNFLGGAILGGGFAVPGHAMNRAEARAKYAAQDERTKNFPNAVQADLALEGGEVAPEQPVAVNVGGQREMFADAGFQNQFARDVAASEAEQAQIPQQVAALRERHDTLMREIDRLKEQYSTATTPEEQAAAVKQASALNAEREQIAKQIAAITEAEAVPRPGTPEARAAETDLPTTITAPMLETAGLSPKSGLFKQLVDKDLTDFTQLDEVQQIVERARTNKNLTQETKDALESIYNTARNLYSQQGEMFGPRGGVLEPARTPRAPKATAEEKLAEITQGKDLKDPVQLEQVREEVTDFANGPTRTQEEIAAASAFLDSLPSAAPEATDVIQPTESVEPAGELSPAVAEQRGEAPAGGVEAPQAGGVDVAGGAAEYPDAGEGVQPAALTGDTTAEVIDITQQIAARKALDQEGQMLLAEYKQLVQQGRVTLEEANDLNRRIAAAGDKTRAAWEIFQTIKGARNRPAANIQTAPDQVGTDVAAANEPQTGGANAPADVNPAPIEPVSAAPAPVMGEAAPAVPAPAAPAVEAPAAPAPAEGRITRNEASKRLVAAGYSREEIQNFLKAAQDMDGTVAEADIDDMTGGAAQKTVIDAEAIAPAVAQLTPQEQEALAEHYGEAVNSPGFLAQVRQDIYEYAVRGQQAIASGIRNIIKKLQAAVMAMVVIVNPNYMSAPIPVAIPKTTVSYEQVQATVPADVRASLSPAAQQAYATIFPAIQADLKAKNKLFVLTDKPNARVVIFTADGKPVLDKKVLLGKAMGDFYKGNVDALVTNRTTPAGLFTLGLRDAAKGGGEAKTAGHYDFGKVFVLDKAIDGQYSITLFHSVWTKEKDAQQRLAALQKEGAEDSRYSFGCINVDKSSYKFLLDNYGQQMNGAKMFVVPDTPGAVMDFVNGKAVASSDLKRDIVQPVVQKVTKTEPGEPAPINPTSDEGILATERRAPASKAARRRGKGKAEAAPETTETPKVEVAPEATTPAAPAAAPAAPTYTNLTPEGERAAALNERMKGISNPQPDGVNTVAKGFLGLNKFFNRGENDPSLRTYLRSQVVDKDASANEKIHAAFNNKVVSYIDGRVRADLLVDQSQDHSAFAEEVLDKGVPVIGKDGLAEVQNSEDNMRNVFNIITEKLGKKLGSADLAMQVAHNAGIAKRASEINKRNAQLEKQAQTAEKKKNFKAAKQLREAMVTVRASQAEIDAGLEALDMYPEINEALDMFTRYNNGLIDFLVACGRIDEATAENWKANTGYVPWTRVEEEVNAFEDTAVRGKVGLLNVGKLPILDRQGSSKEIANIFDNMIGHTSWVIRTALTARAANAMARDLPDAKEITSDIELQQELKKNRSRVIFTYKDGERTPYLLGSAADMPAFMIAPDVIPGIAKPFKAFSDILRNFVTHMPAFALGQLIQDGTYRGMMLSGVEHPFAIPPKVFKNFYQILTGESGIAAELARLGVSGVYDGMPEHVISRAREKFGLKEKTAFQKAWGGLEKFSLAADLAVRAAIYEQTLAETKSDANPQGDRALALYRAKEYINFKRAGANPIVRGLRHVVPFMNAYIQGMDVLVRTMQGKGVSTADKRVAMQLFWGTGIKLMALNVLYTMLVGDDDDYKGLDEYERAKNYIIPGTGVKLPVAPELGFMFKVIPELMTNYIISQGTERPDDAANVYRAMRDAFVNSYSGVNLTPQLVKPALEVAVNYSFFTSNPIVGQAMKNVDPSQQFTSSTSEFSKFVGGLSGISPLKLDYLVRGYTGMLGAFALDATDAIANPNRVDKPINKLPQVSTFMYDPTGRGYKSEFYRFREEVDRVVDTVNLFKREGRADELREYLTEDRMRVYAMRGVASKVEEVLGNLRKYRNIVANDPNMSGEEKLQITQEVQAREKAILLAFNVPKLRHQMAGE